MSTSRPAVEVIFSGSLRQVGFLVLPDGEAPARDYLTALRATKRGAKKVADIMAKLHHLAEERTLGEHFKGWERPILQLKCDPYRVMCFEEEVDGRSCLIVFNAFEKHQRFTPREDENRTRELYRKYHDQARP